MYTGPAWLSVILAVINVFVFLPCMFTEYNIAREEGEYLAGLAAKRDKEANKETPKLKDPDVVGLITCIIVFASVQFNFIFLERHKRLPILHRFSAGYCNRSFQQCGHPFDDGNARMG